MKEFDQLTQRGRIRRYREVAQAALAAYGMQDADVRFNHDSGNVSFRVRTGETHAPGQDLFLPGQYVLRLHQDDYQETEAIRSELEWVEALRKEASVAAPEPIRSLDGDLLVTIDDPELPAPKRCSLLRWMRGRLTDKGIGINHVRAMARTMARMHEHASGWNPPDGFRRWRYTWDGLYGEGNVAGVDAEEARSQILDSVRPVFDEATFALRDVMVDLGEGGDAFGLIHADIGLGDNILFWRGEARPIDFDDCAFGYWMFDVGVAFSHLTQRPDWPALRDTYVPAYREVRSLPDAQWRHLDLFIAAWHAFEIFWAAADAVKYPAWREGSQRWMMRAGENLRRVLGS